MLELTGGCHCGNISVVYRTKTAPEDASPRACQCSFCRKHNTAAVSDNSGDLTISIKDANKLSRYQFGFRTCDFLVCRECGVYVAAFAADPDDSAGHATLMSSCLDDHARFPAPGASDYGNEDAEGRRARRCKVWTPARLNFI